MPNVIAQRALVLSLFPGAIQGQFLKDLGLLYTGEVPHLS